MNSVREEWTYRGFAPSHAAMILEAMIQRLFASLVHGPSMNARPHRSRQRCDWMELSLIKGRGEPASALKTLLEKRKIEFLAKAPAFSVNSSSCFSTPLQRMHIQAAKKHI